MTLKDIKDEHRPVAGFFISSVFWFFVAAIGGLLLASAMVAPELAIYKNVAWLAFGRLRPMHTNMMIFGFVGSALIGSMVYVVPRLVRTTLHSPVMGRASVWIWNIAVATGTVTLALGYTQSREYAEWVWPVDIMLLLVMLLTFYNLLRTVADGKEDLLYVSIWYAFGALVFTFFIYFFGNAVWNPRTGAITGMPDGILAWFYGHGVVGLFLTPLAVGLSYYVMPIVCRAPLFSHALSLVGFWTILMFYPHIGTHHLLQTPAPTWLKIVAVTGSIGMLIPVATVLVNLWLTIQGRLGHIHRGHRRKVRLCRARLVPDRLPPGALSGPAVGAAGHPSDQLGDCPLPYRRPWFFRFHRSWRYLFPPSQDHRSSTLQPETGRHPVLAGPHRPHGVLCDPHHGRPHPGERLALRQRCLQGPP